MDKISPFQIILTAIFGIAALVGVFVFATFQGSGAGKTQVGEVVIWGTLPQDAVDAGLKTLTSTKKEYGKVTYVERPSATFSSDLANALASGSGPSAIIISQESLLSERGKLNIIPFSSIPQRTYLDSYLPLFELFLTTNGTYGIPLAEDPLVLYYNRPMLASVGIPLPPTSWEAVAGLAPVLTKRTDGGVITQSLISLGEYSNVHNARGILSLLLLQAGNPITKMTEQGVRSTLTDTSGSFGTTPAQSAVNFYAQFADPAKSTYSWNRSLAESRSAFVAGDVALYLGYASEQPGIAEANPNLDFDMAPVPAPLSLKNRVTYGLGYAFAIPKASGNAAGGYAAAAALSEKSIAEIIAQGLSMAPARKASLAPKSEDKYTAVYYPEALTARGWLSPAPSVTDSIFSAMIEDIATGKRNLDQAVNVASNALTTASQ